METDRTPISTDIGRLLPLEFRQVRRSELEGLFDGLVEQKKENEEGRNPNSGLGKAISYALEHWEKLTL